MAIYLDSALVYEARVARDLGWVSGITTNPTLLAESELPPEETLRALAAAMPGEIFYQITASTLEDMLTEGWAASILLGSRVVLKIPASPAGFQAAARLSPRIPCAVTSIFSPAQALVAAAVGARYALVYVNRSTRILGNGPALVSVVAQVLGKTTTQIVAASIKSPDEAVAAHQAGAHHLSLPLKVLQAMAEHEMTGLTISEFASKGKGIQF